LVALLTPPSKSQALGVGHIVVFVTSDNPDSVPPVRRIDTASWNNNRLDFVAFCFQVSMHFVEFHVDDPSNILTNDPSWPCFAYNPKHFWPEIAVIVLASLLPSDTEWLAGESASEKSDSCV
jgi:hypothetical protein